MLLWRVVLLVGVVIALALGGAGLWQNQQPHLACRYTKIDGQQVRDLGSCRTTPAHHRAQGLWYAAGAVALTTLTSIPLLRLRDG